MTKINRTVAQIEARRAEGHSPTVLEQALVDGVHASQIEANTPTGDSIALHVTDAMNSLAAMFHETEQKRVGDNGRMYPIDATLPEGVEDTGNEVSVQVWRYIREQVTSVVAWKLEDQMLRCEEQVEDVRKQIKQAVRQLENGRVEVSFIEAKADYLEKLIVQHTMLSHAFEAARVAHVDLLDKEFETRAMRSERKGAEAAKAKSPLSDRLANLGVR